MVISEATLALRADPDEAAEAATRLVTSRGGYVEDRSASGADGSSSSVSLVLRVPAAELEPVLSAIRRTGTLLSESQSGKDVTEEYSDAQAQLRAKRTLEERLLAIVTSAKSVKDMLEVENELTRVRTEIERLDGHSRTLAGQVAFATIRLSYVAPSQPIVLEAETSWSKLRHAFAESGRAGLHVVTSLIVVAGAVAPIAAMGALFVSVFLWFRRRRAALPANPV